MTEFLEKHGIIYIGRVFTADVNEFSVPRINPNLECFYRQTFFGFYRIDAKEENPIYYTSSFQDLSRVFEMWMVVSWNIFVWHSTHPHSKNILEIQLYLRPQRLLGLRLVTFNLVNILGHEVFLMKNHNALGLFFKVHDHFPRDIIGLHAQFPATDSILNVGECNGEQQRNLYCCLSRISDVEKVSSSSPAA